MTAQPSRGSRLASPTSSENEAHLRSKLTIASAPPSPSPNALVPQTFLPSSTTTWESDDYSVGTITPHKVHLFSEHSFTASSTRLYRSATSLHVPSIEHFELSSLAPASSPTTRRESPHCDPEERNHAMFSLERSRESQLPRNPRNMCAPSCLPMPTTPKLRTVTLPTMTPMTSPYLSDRQGSCH